MDIEKNITKIQLNSYYLLPPSNNFCLFDKDVADKITEKGREKLRKIINIS